MPRRVVYWAEPGKVRGRIDPTWQVKLVSRLRHAVRSSDRLTKVAYTAWRGLFNPRKPIQNIQISFTIDEEIFSRFLLPNLEYTR
jgi:hypothetical protein